MRRVALFVGVNDYQSPITLLRCARPDAALLWRSFLPVYDQVELLTDREVSTENIVSKIRALTSTLSRGDMFMFFFAGHGCEVRGDYVLLGAQADPRLLEQHYGCMSLDAVTTLTDGLGLSRLFVVDACREALVAGTRSLGGFSGIRARNVALVPAGTCDVSEKPPVILCSCQEGQMSYEDEQRNHGFFTLAFEQALRDKSVKDFSSLVSRLRENMASFNLPSSQEPAVISEAGTENELPLWPDWSNGSAVSSEKSDSVSQSSPSASPSPSRVSSSRSESGVRFVMHEDEKASLIFPGGSVLGFVKIPKGSCIMGSPENEVGRYSNEYQYEVQIEQEYWMSETPVTQRHYRVFGGVSRLNQTGDDNAPVIRVSWDDAVSFCVRLTRELCVDLPFGYRFDLPTEAQWEYACRAGTQTPFAISLSSLPSRAYFNPYDRDLKDLAWHNGSGGRTPRSVGQLKPNAWGLYDMHGNVWEWCRDCFRQESGSERPGHLTARSRRGGSIDSPLRQCRSAARTFSPRRLEDRFTGFRLVLVHNAM